MSKAREIIRHHEAGLKVRAIARAVEKSRTAVETVIKRFHESGNTFCSISNLSDSELDALIYPAPQVDDKSRRAILDARLPTIVANLKKKHETIQHQWILYRNEWKDGYAYSQFCDIISSWNKLDEFSPMLDHEYGDLLFVDFAGENYYFYDRLSGEKILVRLFVAILPGTLISYARFTLRETTEDWIEGTEGALRFIGGVPKGIVPDCAKAAVKTAHRYESEINPQYNQFAEHYDTLILPARPMHPKDKALVENAVNCIYRFVFPILGEQKYYSLQELNMALDSAMILLNDRDMRKYGCSRRSLFETYEKNTLKALPDRWFEFKRYQAPIKPTCASHIWLREDKHYYSIPYRYMQQKCAIFYTNHVVEVYCDNVRIAVHSRESGIGQPTTVIEHMPPKYCEAVKWTPERITEWAKNTGESTGIVVGKIFSKAKHPFLSLRTCLGIMSLSKRFGASRLNNACKRVISYGYIGSMRQIERILIKGLDSFPDEQATFTDLPQHNNIRYTNTNKEHIA